MLKPQQDLLASIQSAERAALKLCNSGVKISGVVHQLRAAGKELETRVRYLEREAKPKVQQQRPPVSTLTKAELVADFSELDAKGREKTKATIEAALKQNPERADARLALEAINEVIEKAK